MSTEENLDPVQQKIPLTEHLEELRKRVIKCLIVLVIVFMYCYWQSDLFFNFITAPVREAMPNSSSLAMIKLTEGFFTELKLSLMAAIFFSMPFLLLQGWLFIAPALYIDEKKYVTSFVISASTLFFLGAGFAYYIVFPFGFQFFLGYANGAVIANLSIQEYLGFAVKLAMGFGIVFELPIFVLFLAKIGILTSQMMRKYRKFAILGIFVVAAILTPPDVFTQLMMSAPLLVLYEISIFVAQVFGKKKVIKEEEIYE